MCDNTNIHDRVQASIANATREVDIALESVRAMRRAILAQMTESTADLRDIKVTPDEVAKAIETIRRHNADVDRDIYLADDEYMDLANKLKNQATYIGSLETEVQYQKNMDKQLTAQIQRVRELHPPQDAGDPEGFLWCVPCREMYPCPTIKVLDGEQ
jgi:septal ring factor EnvC (AmiA/AmiB activator)